MGSLEEQTAFSALFRMQIMIVKGFLVFSKMPESSDIKTGLLDSRRVGSHKDCKNIRICNFKQNLYF